MTVAPMEWLLEKDLHYQRFDDGDVPMGWPYDKFEMCWGRHTLNALRLKQIESN